MKTSLFAKLILFSLLITHQLSAKTIALSGYGSIKLEVEVESKRSIFITQKLDTLPSSKFHTGRQELSRSKYTFLNTKKGRIAFLGGSITEHGGWRDSLVQYFQMRFPDTEFEFINAGISSIGSTPAAFRLQQDVLSKGKIDLLFEEAAVNDFTNGRSDKEQIRALEGIFRHLLKTNPKMDIVLMHFVDPGKIADYRNEIVPKVIQNHEKVAAYYGINSINLAKEVQERIDNNEFTWEEDFKDLHPSPFGHGVYARSMISFLEKQFSLNIAIERWMRDLPIDEFNYENGELVDISRAKKGKGWIIRNWTPIDRTNTRPGFTKADMLIAEKPGKKLTFDFEGRAVGIVVAAGFDAGIIEYRVDNGEWKKQNLFTQWSSFIHLPWYYTLEAELANRKHTLEIKIAKENDTRSKGNACRIKYFFVNR